MSTITFQIIKKYNKVGEVYFLAESKDTKEDKAWLRYNLWHELFLSDVAGTEFSSIKSAKEAIKKYALSIKDPEVVETVNVNI